MNRHRAPQTTPFSGNAGRDSRPARRLAALAILAASALDSSLAAEDFRNPQTRLQPIGTPSAVDRYRGQPVHQTAAVAGSGNVRQAVMMQAEASPPSTGGMGLPESGADPSSGPVYVAPTDSGTAPLPRGDAPPATESRSDQQPRPGQSQLTPVPQTGPPTAGGGPQDNAPIPQPQLHTRFANLGNCRNVSAPSGYRSDRIGSCGPPPGYVTTVGASAPPPVYTPPPAQLGPPTTVHPHQLGVPLASGQTVLPGSPGYRPLISFGQQRYPVQVGQGLFGQPTAYVPGQSVRNVIRYLTW